MRRGLPVLVFLASSAWFAIGIRLALEWTDSGQLVYPGWRVARGAVPYRDFVHLYGPGYHYLSGWLFRLFGEDLLVLRVSMVFWKAAQATLVWLCARRVAPAGIATGVWLVVVALFGLPLPVFSATYAGHHGMALVLAGVLAIAAGERRPIAAYAVAGLCFGLAATFKQTIGAFAFVAAVLFLLTERGESRSAPSPGLRTLARAGRGAALAACLALLAYYLANENTAANLVVLATPLLIVVARLAADELGGRVSPRCQAWSLGPLLALGLGAALPMLAWLAWFAALGLVPELVFNVVVGVPNAHRWFTAYWPEGTAWIAWLLAVGGGVATLATWGAPAARRPGVAVRVAAAAVFALGSADLLRRGLSADVDRYWWFWLSSDLQHVLPGAAAWAAAIVCFGPWRRALLGPASASRRATTLYACLAIGLLFLLYPSGRLLHAWMALPAFLPVLAALLARLLGGLEGRWRPVGAGLLIVSMLLLSAPSVADLFRERARRASDRHGFERATGIAGPGDLSRDGAELVALLRRPPFAGRPLFVLSGKEMIYFLVGEPSVAEPYEFGLYLVSGDLIDEEAIPSLVDEADLIARLRSARPVVIDDDYNAQGRNARRGLPAVAAWLERSYAPARRVGRFTVLLPRSEVETPSPRPPPAGAAP